MYVINPVFLFSVSPKVPETSFMTRSLSSDPGDNTHDLNTLEPSLQPSEHAEDDSDDRLNKENVCRQNGEGDRTITADRDSISEVKKRNIDMEDKRW